MMSREGSKDEVCIELERRKKEEEVGELER